MTDVGTTERKRLSPSQKLKLYEMQKGICALCETRMRPGEKLIDGHLRALTLGGSNYLGNRAMVHALCAVLKTNGPAGDLAMGAKAKAQKRASLGFKPEVKIRSAGFRASEPQRRATTPIPKLFIAYQRDR